MLLRYHQRNEKRSWNKDHLALDILKTVKAKISTLIEDDTFSLPMVYFQLKNSRDSSTCEGYVGKEISAIIEKITTVPKKHVNSIF